MWTLKSISQQNTMRITLQLLKSKIKAGGSLPLVENLNLANCDLDCIEKLSYCSKLKILNLSNNNIDYVDNLGLCSELWNIDLSNNKVKNLEGLSRFVALGTLVLSNNDLTWGELVKIRHMHILNLILHGNSKLEKDPYYRIHVIDCLPNVWMLDGRIITSAERLQVESFFHASALTDHPVRHKLPRDLFKPTALKNIEVNGIFGERTTHLMKRFPVNTNLTAEIDKKRLIYLACNMEKDFHIESQAIARGLLGTIAKEKTLWKLLTSRNADRERCNMVLLLLVASLTFSMPAQLIKATLDIARLSTIENVSTMWLFLLPREKRSLLVSLLLSAVKVDKDASQDGGLYHKLYLSLYYIVSELVRQVHSAPAGKILDKKTGSLLQESKSLIAAEVVQLFCVVPKFFHYLKDDIGVLQIVHLATGNRGDVMATIQGLLARQEPEGSSSQEVYEKVAKLITDSIYTSTGKLLTSIKFTKQQELLKAKKYLPKRPQSSLVKSDYHMTGGKQPDRKLLRIHSCKPLSVPKVGDKVLLGPQNIARVVSVPDANVVLVQMDVVPSVTGAMVRQTQDPSEHYTYIDTDRLRWDRIAHYWRPKGTIGDRISIKSLKAVKKRKNSQGEESSDTSRGGIPAPPSSPEYTASSIPCAANLLDDPPVKKPEQKPRAASANYKERLNLQLSVDEEVADMYSGQVGQLASDLWLMQNGVAGTSADPKQPSAGQLSSSRPATADNNRPERPDSNRSSLDSMEEPELQDLGPDSRPVSRPSKGISPGFKSNLILQGTPENPIDIPQVPEFDDTSSYTADGSSATTVNITTPVDLQTSGKNTPSAITLVAESNKQVHSATPHEELLDDPAVKTNTYTPVSKSLHEPQPTPSISSTTMYDTSYQNKCTEAWKNHRETTPGSATSRTGSSQGNLVPPQRPTSPSSGKYSPLKVQRGETWLAGGRNLYTEGVQKRPNSSQKPGWMEGLKSRPNSAALRAIRRSQPSQIVTPSSLVHEHVYGRTSGPWQRLDILHNSTGRPNTGHHNKPNSFSKDNMFDDDVYVRPKRVRFVNDGSQGAPRMDHFPPGGIILQPAVVAQHRHRTHRHKSGILCTECAFKYLPIDMKQNLENITYGPYYEDLSYNGSELPEIHMPSIYNPENDDNESEGELTKRTDDVQPQKVKISDRMETIQGPQGSYQIQKLQVGDITIRLLPQDFSREDNGFLN